MYPPKSGLLFIFLLMFGCAPKSGDKLTKNSPVPVPAEEIPTVLDTVDRIDEALTGVQVEPIITQKNRVIATLKTTPCYGKCPVYELKFWENQYVVRRGYAHTDNIGRYEAKLPGKVAEEIRKRAEMSGLYEMENRYPNYGEFLEDYPSVIVHVFDAEKEKRIVDIYDAPQGLKDFENYLLSVTKNLVWTEIEEYED